MTIALFGSPLVMGAATTAASPSFSSRAFKAPVLPEALVRFGPTSTAEDVDLERALARYARAGKAADLSPIDGFLRRYPNSNWRVSVLLNKGLIEYREGYFSRAIASWEVAWTEGRNAPPGDSKAIADRALGELIRMHARLGHADAVQQLLHDADGRALIGPATEAVQGAREGLWEMRNEPEVAYLCGPMALKSVGEAGFLQFNRHLLEAARSGPAGYSLAQVAKLADQAGLPLRPSFRERGTEIPVPSVVHWKVNHYAAIVSVQDGRYRIQDPTFGRDLWMSAEAINDQASGYFLRSPATSSEAWRDVSSTEANVIHGMGYTTALDDRANRPYDEKDCAECEANKERLAAVTGMPFYTVHSMLASLNLEDTPVGYAPPKGPAIRFTVTYNQREAYQPAVFPFSNLGPKWTHGWLSYVTDDPTTPGASVSVAVRGGGTESYGNYNSGTGAFGAESKLGAVLVRTSGTPIIYERRFSDGAIDVYQQSDGSTLNGRRIFLTASRDPHGNTVSLGYDGQLRLTTLTDALGQVTTLAYGDAANPLRITKVTDPFGRFATFGYDATGRLNQIVDVIGLSSTFGYDAGTFLNSLTTPYGTTTFAYSESGIWRWVQATDPLSKTETIETRHQAPGIAGSDPVVPSGILAVNAYLDARNSYYWDKDAWAAAPGDYTKAVIKHFLHQYGNGTVTSPTLESVMRPGERREWFNYQGQTQGHFQGPTDWQTARARVLDDGSTQVTRTEYNAIGRVTKATDPVGREEAYEYAANNLDLTKVKRKNGAAYETLAEYTYNAQHQPLTRKDEFGQTTVMTYNAAGQVLTRTNALSQTTTYTYDVNGYLQNIKNASNVVVESFTYDAFGRVRTRADSEGWARTFDYDSLDRVTQMAYPDGTTEIQTYDKLDPSQLTDRLGRTTTYHFNAVRQLVQIDAPVSNTTQFSWSPAGRRTQVKDQKFHTINWAYNFAGRQVSETYHDGAFKTFGYDSAGRLISITDPLNQTKSMTYTLDDRLATESYINAVNPTATVTRSYDPVHPRLASMTDGIGTTSFAYGAIGGNGADMVLREDGPYASNDVVAYTYDVLGRRASRTIGATYSGGTLTGGELESYSYDNLGRLQTKTNVLGTFTFAYLGETSQLTSRTIAASGTLNTPAMLLTYDTNTKDRRLKQIRYAKNGTPAPSDYLQDYAYSTNAKALITKVDETSYGTGGGITMHRIWDVTHAPVADRLTTYAPASGTGSGTSWFEYDYDTASNRTAAYLNGANQTVTNNTLDQATVVNGKNYTYDANGNLLTYEADSFSGSPAVLKWDAENRLISFKPGGAAAKTFVYDGFGRRLQSNLSPSYRQLWCDYEVCQTRNGTNFATVYATWFEEGYRAGTASNLYFRDQLGSVRQVRPRNNTNVGKLDYGPFGELFSTSGSPLPSPRFGWANMYQENGIDFHFAWTRVYDDTVGRWISRDPIGVRGGINLYRYMDADPLGGTDPKGLVGWIGAAVPIIGFCFVGYELHCILKGMDGCQRRFPTFKDTRGPDYPPFTKCQAGVVHVCSFGMVTIEPIPAAAEEAGKAYGEHGHGRDAKPEQH